MFAPENHTFNLMKNTYQLGLLLISFLFLSGCKHTQTPIPHTSAHLHEEDFAVSGGGVYLGWPETFESGTKTSYSAGNVTLSTGVWNLTDALLGTSTSDRKNGTKSVRIQNTGKLSMTFDLSQGASSVSILHAKFGTDANSSWDLYASTNNGSTWSKLGNTITTSSTTLQAATFPITFTGNIRFEVRKLGGGRLNIDNFQIQSNANPSPTPTRDDNLALGNPSGAQTNILMPNNYLVTRSQFSLAYNNSRGTCAWVSWHLSQAWKGTATRCNCFKVDPLLPTSFYRAASTHYSNTGFDRGHMCPSDDRDGNASDNEATFYMSNIVPQAPNNNQITWANLENYLRTLLPAHEVYILSGVYGQGGTGSNGGTTNTINNGNIVVPSRLWKVAVILSVGSNDVSRITTSTRVIAVDMPNTQNANTQPWGFYRTTVDNIESATGLNLLSSVPSDIQNTLEALVDNGPTN